MKSCIIHYQNQNIHICPAFTYSYSSVMVDKPSCTVASIYTYRQICFMQPSSYLWYSEICTFTLSVKNPLPWRTEIRYSNWKKKKGGGGEGRGRGEKETESRLLFYISYPWVGSPIHTLILVLMLSLTKSKLLTQQKIFWWQWWSL